MKTQLFVRVLLFAAAVSMAFPGEAAIVYVDIPELEEGFFHFPLDDPGLQDRTFDLNGDGVVDLTFRTSPYSFFVLPSLHAETVSTGPEGLAPLAIGTGLNLTAPLGLLWSSLPQGITFAFNDGGGTVAGGPWYGLGEQYLGFRFEDGSGEHYGWMRMHPIGPFGALFRDYAYSTDADQPVTVGSVPEPTTALLLCIGFTLSAIRRRS